MNKFSLKAVDALTLPQPYREHLKPAEPVADANGNIHRLPRFFYELPSWSAAHEIVLASHFKLAELMMVDCREADLLLRSFPHYVPCAVAVLAGYLECLRHEVSSPIFVSANGGYRSPAHQLAGRPDIHSWGTAADIYRIGGTYLDDEKAIAKYASVAEGLGPAVRVKRYSPGDDHLHLDLGFLTMTPSGCSEDS